MNREKDILYVETDPQTETEEPRALGILSLVFGIASIVLVGPLGIVFGALAQKFASYILSRAGGGVSAGRARAGQITGSVGLALSIAAVALFVLLAIAAIWLLVYVISGNPIFY